MSVSIPQPFVTSLGGSISTNLLTPAPLATSLTITNSPLKTELSGIPTDFTIGIDQLPEIRLNITNLPAVEIRLTELPSIRAHLPAAFNVGLSVLGIELLSVRLCGEAQMITEPYEANPCEHCDRTRGTIDIKQAVELIEGMKAAEAEG